MMEDQIDSIKFFDWANIVGSYRKDKIGGKLEVKIC